METTESPATQNSTSGSARAIWARCAWIGLICGLFESGFGLAWNAFGYQVSDPDLWVNWHAPWLAPLSLATIFGAFGVVASAFHTFVPRITSLVTPYLLIALGTRSALEAIPGLHAWAVAVLVVGLAFRLGRYARLDSDRFRRFARKTLPYAACVWIVVFVTTGVLPATAELRALAFAPAPKEKSPNVILIVLDTVRADNLGLYGYARNTTPNLEALAKRGVRFDQARSTSPFTLGTHASLFTGHWMTDTSVKVNAPLDGALPTIAEHLRDRGYATAGFMGNIFYGSAHYGLDRGFSHYHDVPENITRRVTPREFLRASRLGESLVSWCERKWRIFQPMQKRRLDAGELNREALAWIDASRNQGRPFFLFMNYFDAHSPFTLPGDAPQPYSKRTPESLDAETERLKSLQARQERRPDSAIAREIAKLRPEVHADLVNAYDDGIAWIDRKLGELMTDLERRGILDDTLIIITADHGEMLGEHDLIGHGDSLHRPVVHVPLIVIGPKESSVPRGNVITQAASVRDVPATIVELAGLSAPSPFPGRSLGRFWSNDSADEPVLSEMEHMSWMPRSSRMPASYGPMTMLTEGSWSYHRQQHESLGLRESLFDLSCDPNEDRDLANDPAHRETLARMRSRFAAIRAAKPLS